MGASVAEPGAPLRPQFLFLQPSLGKGWAIYAQGPASSYGAGERGSEREESHGLLCGTEAYPTIWVGLALYAGLGTISPNQGKL